MNNRPTGINHDQHSRHRRRLLETMMHAATGLFLATACTPLPAAHGEGPFPFDKAPGKFPKSVIPPHYTIRIEPDLGKATLRGEETIEIEVREPVRELVLNSLGLEITDAALLGAVVTP